MVLTHSHMGGPQKFWFTRGFTHIWDLIPWGCSIGWDHLIISPAEHQPGPFSTQGTSRSSCQGKAPSSKRLCLGSVGFGWIWWTWSCLLWMTWSLLHVLFYFLNWMFVSISNLDIHILSELFCFSFFPSVYGSGIMHPPVAKDVQWRQIMKDRDLLVASNIH